MPQRYVASNFTFEQQRVEINNLAQDFWTQKGTVDTAAPTYLKHDGSNAFTGQTLNVPNAFTINSNSGSGTVTISGNLDVTGTTTTVSSTNLEVTDKNILISKGSTTDAQADGAGITIDSATPITFNFVDANDALVSSIGLEATTFLKGPYGQFTGSGTPSTGQGVEINAPDSTTGQIISYDRGSTAYKELRVKGSSVGVYAGTNNALVGSFNSTGLDITGTVTTSGQLTGNSSNTGKYVRMYGSAGTGRWDIYGHGANLRFSDNDSAGNIVFDHNVEANSDLFVGAPASNTLTHKLLVQAGGDANAIAVIGRADGIGELSFYENDASTKQGEIQFRDAELNIRHRKEGAEINFVTCPNGGSITDRLTILGSGQIKCLGGAAGVNALEVTGNYAASGNVDIQTWQRSGGAVQSKMIYRDADTDMIFGTDTAHAFSLMTSGTSRLRITSTGQVEVGNPIVAEAAATTEFFQATSTDNGTRAVGSFSGKETNGTVVTLKLGGYGDTKRGEIFTHSNHDLGFATNNAATQMVLDTSGRLLIGDTSSRVAWGINGALQVTGTGWDDSTLLLQNFGNNTTRPSLIFSKGRSGTVGNYGTAVGLDEGMGIIGWAQHDTTDANNLAAYIDCISTTVSTANNVYGAIQFVTVDGGTTGYERLRICANGDLTLGKGDDASTNYGRNFQIHDGGTSGAALHLTQNASGSGNSDGFHLVFQTNHIYHWLREAGDQVFATASTERLRIHKDGHILTPASSPIASQGSKSQQSGGFETYNDQHVVEIADSTNTYHVMRSWTATKWGDFRVEFEAMIQSGAYYFAYDIFNSTQGKRISANGTGNEVTDGLNNCRWTDHLDTGFGSAVHSMKRFSVRCGAGDYPVAPGDVIQLRMASTNSNGTLVTGNGQVLKCEHLQIFNDSPALETGGRGYQPSPAAFHVVMGGGNQTFGNNTDLTWNNGYTAFNRGYRRSNVSGNPVNSGFDISNSRFIVPYTGIYAFYVNLFVNTTSNCRMAVTIDGVGYQSGYIWGCNTDEGQSTPNQSGFQTLYLGAGSNIKLRIVSGSLDNTYGGHTSWGGYLVG